MEEGSEKSNKSLDENNIKNSDIQEKLKKWLKNKDNLLFSALFLFSILVGFYYFSMTANQPLWWDEAEYMSIAQNWAFGVPYEINAQRPILFPFLQFVLLKLSFSETLIKFILVLLPSLLCVVLTYFFVKELYDKRIAILASFITSVSWIHLFYATRMMTDAIGLMFGLLAFFFFWKGYVKKESKYFVWLTGFFIGLSFLIRLTGILYGVVIFFFVLSIDKFKFIKNKNIWIMLSIFLLTISPLFVWGYYSYSNPLAFKSGYGGVPSADLGWWMFQLFYDYPELVFFIFFIIGLITIVPMILSFDQIIKGKNKMFYNDFFIILTILFTFGFFFYFLRAGENRWLIMMSIGIFVLSAKGIIFIYDYCFKHLNKTLAIIVLIFILLSGAYFQLNHADKIIKLKLDSYSQVKDSGLWLRENTNKNDSIVSASVPQHTYYSEREIISFFNVSANRYYSSEEFEGIINEMKPKYFVVSIFESYIPQWINEWPSKHSSMAIPVQAYYADLQKTQPLLIIYEIKY